MTVCSFKLFFFLHVSSCLLEDLDWFALSSSKSFSCTVQIFPSMTSLTEDLAMSDWIYSITSSRLCKQRSTEPEHNNQNQNQRCALSNSSAASSIFIAIFPHFVLLCCHLATSSCHFVVTGGCYSWYSWKENGASDIKEDFYIRNPPSFLDLNTVLITKYWPVGDIIHIV